MQFPSQTLSSFLLEREEGETEMDKKLDHMNKVYTIIDG